MCNCNFSPCGCNSYSQIYGTNFWNGNHQSSNISSNCGHPQACNGCLDIIKSECVQYTGSNLGNLLIDKYDDLSTILPILDEAYRVQQIKNTNILTALNDINTRLNALEGGPDHAPYTI